MNKFEKNCIFQKRKCLSPMYCEELIKYFEMVSTDSIGSSGGLYNHNRRKKNSIDISTNIFDDNSPIIETLRTKLFESLREMCKRKPFTYLNDQPKWACYKDFNIQKYNPGGGFYETHCEHSPTSEDGDGMYSNRILSWMFYLNDVTDKGGTHFPIQNITLKARQGDLYIWPAGWTHMHCGVPSPTQTKYIATGWANFEYRKTV